LIRKAVAFALSATELSVKSFTMRLNLALNGILVASAPLDPSRCKDEFYLQALRQQIIQQNLDTINLIPAKPFFYIEVPASAASLSYGKNERKFDARLNANWQ
jgi:hypothetical protein